MKKMMSGKAVTSYLLLDVWKCLETAVEFQTSTIKFERVKIPEECTGVLAPIFKNKGDVQSCKNYRRIKFMSHTMKLLVAAD